MLREENHMRLIQKFKQNTAKNIQDWEGRKRSHLFNNVLLGPHNKQRDETDQRRQPPGRFRAKPYKKFKINSEVQEVDGKRTDQHQGR
ncbi:hypothetical protein V2J09_024254 [Rumex salicifolius]